MTLLQISIGGAALILLITLVRAALKLPRTTLYAMWLLALLRLLTPISIPVPANLFFTHAVPAANTSAHTYFHFTSPSAADIPILESAPKAVSDTQVPLLPIIWAAGAVLLSAVFAATYFHSSREFKTSLPVQDGYIKSWLNAHPLKRQIAVRTSDKINTPITYGIFRPVILLPKNADLDNKSRLEFILAHEYIHIKRFDAALKLLLSLTLCIHWFNPLVWLMYILFNRDIELSCDSRVIRLLGEASKAGYANTLIDMEEQKSGFTPFYSSFGNAAKERITSIMKTKRTTPRMAAISCIAILAVLAVFALSACTPSDIEIDVSPENTVSNESSKNPLPTSQQAAEGVDKLLAFKADGYSDMSIADFNAAILSSAADLSQLTQAYEAAAAEISPQNENYDFITVTMNLSLSQLSASLSEVPQIRCTAVKELKGEGHEYDFCFALDYILKFNAGLPEICTVGQRDSAVREFIEQFQKSISYIGNRTLRSYVGGQRDEKKLLHEELSKKADKIAKTIKKETGVDLSLSEIENASIVIDGFTDWYASLVYAETDNANQIIDKLLSFKIDGYKDMPVREFNSYLLNSSSEITDLLNGYSAMEGYVSPEDENYEFIMLTMNASLNDILYQQTGEFAGLTCTAERNEYLRERFDEYGKPYTDYDLKFSTSYSISCCYSENGDITVAERDSILKSFVSEYQAYIDSLPTDSHTESELHAELTNDLVSKGIEIAQNLSDGRITLEYEYIESSTHRNYRYES